jgi:hypothetical protein
VQQQLTNTNLYPQIIRKKSSKDRRKPRKQRDARRMWDEAAAGTAHGPFGRRGYVPEPFFLIAFAERVT